MLKTARKLKGLKQYELAERLGISASYLSKLENSRVYENNITIELIKKISIELDLCPIKVFMSFYNDNFICPFVNLKYPFIK